jgi:hypothetical protein
MTKEENENQAPEEFLAIMMKYSQGNPGGLRVMMDVIRDYGPVTFTCLLYDFDRQNIRGTEIWRRYKDENGEDLHKFVSSVWSGSQEYLRQIKDGERAKT